MHKIFVYSVNLFVFLLFWLDSTHGFSTSHRQVTSTTLTRRDPAFPSQSQRKKALGATSEVASLIDPARAAYEMQAFEAYGTVTALAINACLYLYTDYESSEQEDVANSKIYSSLFNASSSLCIISGSFTVLLFTLLVIYGQSALGKGNEEGFVLFWSEINSFAFLGFQSFLACSGSLIFSFLLSLKSKIADDDKAGNVILAVSVALVLAGAVQIESILSLATNLIFTPEVMTR